MSDTATQGIDLKLKDGTVVKADTPEEALKTLAKMYEDTKDWAKGKLDESHQEMETIKAEQLRLSQQVLQNTHKDNGNGFDKDRYYQLLNQDPVMAANYVDAQRFGIQEPSQVPSHFQRMDERITAYEGQMLAGQFLQQHAEDFPQSAEAAKDLRGQMEYLTKQGHPATIDTLNMAYDQLIGSGKIKPLEKHEQERDEPNPSPGGSGANIPEAELAKAENMSDADLEKYLRQKGVLK